MPRPDSSTQTVGDGSEASPPLTTGVAHAPSSEQRQTSNSTNSMGEQSAHSQTFLDTAANTVPSGRSTEDPMTTSTHPSSATPALIPTSTHIPGSASGVANASSPVQPYQSSERLFFGPPPPPQVTGSPSRTSPTYAHNGIPEGVIQGILQGILGPMANIQRATSPASAPANMNPRQDSETDRTALNVNINGTSTAPSPDLGSMFSMFGLPQPASQASGSETQPVNVAQSASAPAQNDPALGASSVSGGAAPSESQRQGRFGPSEYSFTFDLGPIGISGLADAGSSFGDVPRSPTSRSNTQDAAPLAQQDPSSGQPQEDADVPPETTGQSGSPNASDNGSNLNNRAPPMTFFLGPNVNWLQPLTGGAGPTVPHENGPEASNQVHGQDTTTNNTGENVDQPPPLAPPLFHFFHRLFQNGMPSGAAQPGVFNFTFGFPSFMQTRLPPDPERAEELLRGLKDPGMDLMIRLDRIVRADALGTTHSGAKQEESEGDADGWKCAVCMEGIEDEIEAHKQDENEPDGDNHDKTEANDFSILERISRTNSIASDTDMQDVEMALNGEIPESPKNKTSLKVFPCHHVFHEDCLRPWLAQKTTCPTCRFDIDPHSVTLRRPVMPQGRANPLRPRPRNAATSNARATPYGSRPISPSTNGDTLASGASNLTRTRPVSAGNNQNPVAANDERQVDPHAPSTTGPAFSHSEVPRSPFAFPRPDRGNSHQINTSGHVDRPPPIAQPPVAASGIPDDSESQSNPQSNSSGSNLTAAGMQDALQMLHELLNRAGRNEPSPAGQSANNGSEINRSPPTANASRSLVTGEADPRTGQIDHDMEAGGNRPEAGDAQSGDVGQSRHPHSHTIAIFEIALPDMPANMMPDTFQGPNGGPPQPFGPNAFRSFMAPFPGMGEGLGNAHHEHDQNNDNNDAGQANQAPENPRTASSTASQGGDEGSRAPSNPITPGGASGNQPPRPHLHRWMSDFQHRPPSSFPLPPTVNLPPLESLGESDSTPIERRRGDERWQIPQVKGTFAEWVLAREKALHWCCDDPVCLYAPPKHPFTDGTQVEWEEWKPTTESLTRINSYKQHHFIGSEYTVVVRRTGGIANWDVRRQLQSTVPPAVQAIDSE
ncbi:hypothetical protein NliqN6_5640 [Naganishia liquefaciens]|uniref:RING-type domain-containing protein n=1 Tax=Naganishia liquefaciens TaxID=104408 RepID=A0A8H3TYM6_9TREE|nr:hypothetical protein NliqN6_5640 [Naganishia liquefaciens]